MMDSSSFHQHYQDETDTSLDRRCLLNPRTQVACKSRRSLLLRFIGMSLASITIFQCVLAWKILSQFGTAELLEEVNGLFPSVGTRIVRFDEKPNFHALNMYDPEWERVMPRGGGFVKVPDWDKEGNTLPRPIKAKGQTVYNIAIFHQLHCLHALGLEFNNLISAAQANRSTVVSHDQLEHIEHCLAYLKESLECSADTAFEGQSSITVLPSTSGFGSYHVCKDFDQIMALSEQRRATEMSGYGQSQDHQHR